MYHCYLQKSCTSLQTANDLYQRDNYDDAASRAYYACYQIACVALRHYGVIDMGHIRNITHKKVLSDFSRYLINEQKIYPIEIKGYLKELQEYRQTADYELDTNILLDEAKDLIDKANEFHRLIKESLSMDRVE